MAVTDKTNQLFTFAQVELEKEKKDEEQQPPDISNKVRSKLCICL